MINHKIKKLQYIIFFIVLSFFACTFIYKSISPSPDIQQKLLDAEFNNIIKNDLNIFKNIDKKFSRQRDLIIKCEVNIKTEHIEKHIIEQFYDNDWKKTSDYFSPDNNRHMKFEKNKYICFISFYNDKTICFMFRYKDFFEKFIQ